MYSWLVVVVLVFCTTSFLSMASLTSSTANKWSLQGKRIIVTGGTKGIGKAIVEDCAALGAEVITCARSAESIATCQQEWQHQGYQVHACVADLSQEDGRQEFVKFVQGKCGSDAVHALVNNVGTNVRKRALDYTEDEYERIMNTNLHSAFHLTRSMHPLLKRANGGAVVNIGSVAGKCLVFHCI